LLLAVLAGMIKRTHKIAWLHVAAVTAAVVAVMLIATGASLWHIDAPGSAATCPICHFAHISVLPGLPAESVSVHVIVADLPPAAPLISALAPVVATASPRAPPLG
jgi:hypothetical protein